MLARKFLLKRRFDGIPKDCDFALVEETLPELQDGEILTKGIYHSVDPYMRMAASHMKEGDLMPGRQIATVLKSKNPDVPVGTIVMINSGWRDLTVYRPPEEVNYDNFYILPDMKGLPLSYALGAVGRIGNTALFGLTEICEPKEGQTLVVSTAAGAVGSLVGQIGKIKGLKVIGFAGSDDKVKWLKELGFDQAYNYKTCYADTILKAAAPEGVDLYFDNVGLNFSYHVMNNMNLFGRVSLCGAISTYNDADDTQPQLCPVNYHNWIYKQLRVEGFVVSRWKHKWIEGLETLRDWVLDEKIQVKETIVEGFDEMPQAFIKLFTGFNMGKTIVKA